MAKSFRRCSKCIKTVFKIDYEVQIKNVEKIQVSPQEVYILR